MMEKIKNKIKKMAHRITKLSWGGVAGVYYTGDFREKIHFNKVSQHVIPRYLGCHAYSNSKKGELCKQTPPQAGYFFFFFFRPRQGNSRLSQVCAYSPSLIGYFLTGGSRFMARPRLAARRFSPQPWPGKKKKMVSVRARCTA